MRKTTLHLPITLATVLLFLVPLGAPGALALAAEACVEVDASWWVDDSSQPGRARVTSCPDDLPETPAILYSGEYCGPRHFTAVLVVCGKSYATPPDGPTGQIMVTGCGRANGTVVSVEGGELGCLLFP